MSRAVLLSALPSLSTEVLTSTGYEIRRKSLIPLLCNRISSVKRATWEHREIQTFMLLFPRFLCSGWYLPRFPGPESPSGRKPPAASPAEHWISQEQPALLQQPRGVPGGIPRGPGPHERLQGPSKRIQRWAALLSTPDLCLAWGNARAPEQLLNWPALVRLWDWQ